MLVTRHHRPNALDAWWFRCSEKISILASRLQESRYQALRDQIISLAVRYAIPVSYPGRGYVDAGGLISDGIEFVDVYHRCAAYVVRILRGEAPQNLPVQQPTPFQTRPEPKGGKTNSIGNTCRVARPRRRGDRIARIGLGPLRCMRPDLAHRVISVRSRTWSLSGQ